MINLDYRDSRSIHQQIADGFRELIVKEILKPDEQMPSVRELSVSLTVNPNTVQKAYKQMELDGYIYSVKGKGSFVSSAKEVRGAMGTETAYENLRHTVRELVFMGESEEKIIKTVREIYSEREE